MSPHTENHDLDSTPRLGVKGLSLLAASFILIVLGISYSESLVPHLFVLAGTGLACLTCGYISQKKTAQQKVLCENLRLQTRNIDTQLLESEERYRILTDNLAASVVIRDADGKVVYCSPYTEVLTGYAVSEIYTCPDDFFVHIAHPEDREKIRRALQICHTGEAFQFRGRFTHRSGIEMWVETRTVPVIDSNGSLLFSLSIALDITGTVRYQKQVEEKNRDLQDFTYMVSHDLKAPIFTIKGMANILEEDLGAKLSPDTREALTHISVAATRLEQLVSSVLEFSRISSQDMAIKEVDLNQIMKDLENDFATQVQMAEATIRIPSDLPSVVGDPIRLYQVFSNIVGNALKYRCESRPCQISISCETLRDERHVCIKVCDNGLGIPSEKLESIFRPFQRAHVGKIEGVGVGLACVKKILEKIGGSIRVESTEGVGSAFLMTFRLGKLPTVEIESAPVTESSHVVST